MIYLFSFSVDPKTQEGSFAGNIPIAQALDLLQQLTIADAVRRAKQEPQEAEPKKGKEHGKGKGQPS